jgi:branched-chain amino acid transport system ATP-binding protein
MAEPILAVQDLEVVYPGGVRGIKGVSLEVQEGEIVALLGSNGAGKSTLLNGVCGILRPRTGRVSFQGKDITKTPAHVIMSLGVCQAPEGRRVFAPLTVRENLLLGAYTQRGRGVDQSLDEILGLFPRLRDRLAQLAGTLSGGEQQMLAIGRALMGKPKLLLLDEPSLGLAPLIVRSIFATVLHINEQGTSVLLVEQDARAALRLANRAYVLDAGEMVLSGAASDLARDPRVEAAYLGGSVRKADA